MTLSFSAAVAEWARDVEGALEAVFKESVEELLKEMDKLLVQSVYAQPPRPSYPKRTGFLRASIEASTIAMPQLIRENPGVEVPFDIGPIVLVINGADLGETIYLGYTANYAAYTHFSTNGNVGRPWVTLAAQRWEIIVARVSARVRSRLGL